MSKKISFSVLIFFVLLLFSFSFLAIKTRAQIPGYKTPPCDADPGANPEFHSLRPYQAAPCGDKVKGFFCGNIINIVESKTEKRRGNYPSINMVWKVGIPKEKSYVIDLSETEFPILGNTEDVRNSQSANDSIDDATKVNEYASWYLSGVNNKAEYGDTKNTDTELINFSGPIQKLLPGSIQEAQRIISIEKAVKEVSYVDDDGGSAPGESVQLTEPANHNQIVVCANKSILNIFGRTQPHECYAGDGSAAKDEYRLKDWYDGDLSILNTFFNWVGTDIWNKKYPPLPWQFDEGVLYQKAYNEWQGKSCAILFNKLICLDNPGVSNEWADLFSYIPLSNTADRNTKMPIYSVTIQAPQSPLVYKHSTIVEDGEPVLFFPHTHEVKELSELLNKTYIPQGVKGETLPSSTENNSLCRTVNVRTNPGDDLFPEVTPGDIMVDVSFEVNGDVPCQKHYTQVDKDTGELVEWSECTAEVYIGIHTNPVQVPWAEEIWNNTVANSTSTFRKIFPKTEAGAPVSCIADIPSVTHAKYEPVSGADKIGVEGPDGSIDQTNMDPEDAKIYFPHIGSLYEYFLKGIQTALRPQGYGEPLVNGAYCNTANCGELPDLPKASGSCALGGVSSRVGNIPQSLKDIVEAAAETYQVPPDLILGVMYGEGVFNPGEFNWTDENVANWATCQPIPGCVAGPEDDNFLGFFESDWATISQGIDDDLKALDPTRAAPNRCNLLDAIYGAAWDLHDNADGSPFFPAGAKCFGKPLNRATNVPSSCSWDDSQFESAIRVWEFGTGWGYTSNGLLTCATKPGSCASGGGVDAQCETDTPDNFDTCQNNDSHNACVWGVAHGN